MLRLLKIVLIAMISNAIASSGFSQLRMPSPYFQDRINPEATYFVLYDKNTAEFGWSTEWTQTTARTSDYGTATFLWHFKDGTQAYMNQEGYIGDFGMLKGYLETKTASELKDNKGNVVQPMTLKNYPVKIELWIGATVDEAGYASEILVDAVCFEADTIEYGHSYYFTSCNGTASR